MAKDDKNKTVTIRLQGWLRRALERQAKREGVKLSEIVRTILKASVEQEPPVGSSTRVLLDEIKALRHDLGLRRRREGSK